MSKIERFILHASPIPCSVALEVFPSESSNSERRKCYFPLEDTGYRHVVLFHSFFYDLDLMRVVGGHSIVDDLDTRDFVSSIGATQFM
jgi:hypothetical protein